MKRDVKDAVPYGYTGNSCSIIVGTRRAVSVVESKLYKFNSSYRGK